MLPRAARRSRTAFHAGARGPLRRRPDRFSALAEADQDAWLQHAGRTRPSSSLVRTLTLMGFFALSAYGGNRNGVGWALIGFDGHGAATPPFGHYDAQYREARGDER
jgi:hypothetical protein